MTALDGTEAALEDDIPARRRVYQHVLQYPGLHLSEVTRSFDDLGESTVRYHLDRLEREGLVSRIDEGGYSRFYPRVEGGPARRDLLSAEEKRVLALLRQRVPLGVVLHLLQEEELPQGALAEAVDVAPSTLSHHLKKLREAGVVERRVEGRRSLYALTDPVEVGDLLYRFEPPQDLADAFVDLFEDIGL